MKNKSVLNLNELRLENVNLCLLRTLLIPQAKSFLLLSLSFSIFHQM